MMGMIDDERRKSEIMADDLYGKYDDAVDNESAYEILTAKNKEDAAAKAEAAKAEADAKAREKEEKETAKAKEKAEKQKAAAKKKTSSALGKAASSAASSIGRQVGNSLARGLLGTLKKWF